MPASMTPIEEDLIYTHLPLPKERDEWKRRIEEIEGDSERVQISRMLYNVLDKELGKALEKIIDKKDAFERLNTLFTISLLPQDMKINAETAQKVINSPDHEEELHKILQESLKKIIPKLGDIKSTKSLSNGEYLQNLFKYHNHYAKTRDHLEIFQMIQKAFLEDGAEGVKKLQYHAKEFEDSLPDEKMRGFAEKLDKEIGEVSASNGGSSDLYELMKGKFEDFENHSQQESLEDVEEAGKKIEELKPQLEKALQSMEDKELSKKINKLVEGKNNEEMKKELENLKKQSLEGSKERSRNYLIGILTRITNLSSIQAVSDSIKTGEEVVEELKKMKGKPFEEQERMLRKIQEKQGAEKLEKAASTLGAMGKASFQDLNYFIKQVLNPPHKEEGTITSHVTHDASELFTLGKFENNCQSPGIHQSQSLLGFVAHPSELVIGHYLDNEFIGFTFAHFLKSEDNNYAILFERAYSNHGTLKTAMQQNIDKIKEKINEMAKKEKIPLKAIYKEESKGKYKVMHSPHVSKWYDCYSGEVRGGETI